LTQKTANDFENILDQDFLTVEMLLGDSDPLSRQEEILLLRDIYIPMIVNWYHELLYETRDIIPG